MLRSSGDTDATARALQLRSRIAQRRGEGTQVALASEAVELLEQGSENAPLVAAYEQLTNVYTVAGAYAEAIAAADRARALAAGLGLPEPARALGYRGFAQAFLGSPEGLAEMERALALLVQRAAGRDAAVLQNNLAIARYPLQGPARSLAEFATGIEFCEQRGLRDAVGQLQANRPGLLAELGRVSEALDDASLLAPTLHARGDVYTTIELRAVALACRVSRGERAPDGEVDWLVETARTIGTVDISVMAFTSAAATSLADSSPERALALLVELTEVEGSRGTPYYGRALPSNVRTALAAGDRHLAQRLTEGIQLRNPLNEHALCAASAQLAQHAFELSEAVGLYSEAAARWQEFGNVPERAYALLGQGRCLRALGRAGAEEPLLEARELFASMGYKPALAETEELLRQPAPVPGG
jgi:tetratricopeptide (TPR) repeat protein